MKPVYYTLKEELQTKSERYDLLKLQYECVKALLADATQDLSEFHDNSLTLRRSTLELEMEMTMAECLGIKVTLNTLEANALMEKRVDVYLT